MIYYFRKNYFKLVNVLFVYNKIEKKGAKWNKEFISRRGNDSSEKSSFRFEIYQRL